MHVWNYLCTCLTRKFIEVHIPSRVQAHVKSKTSELQASSYIRACLASKFIDMHILWHVITSTQATHELPKNVTETNASLMHTCMSNSD